MKGCWFWFWALSVSASNHVHQRFNLFSCTQVGARVLAKERASVRKRTGQGSRVKRVLLNLPLYALWGWGRWKNNSNKKHITNNNNTMSDSEDVSLPVPTRSSLVPQSSVSLLSGFSGRASRKVDALASTLGRNGGSRRLLQSSFTSGGSYTGGGTDKASSGGPGGGGGKACTACGMPFTWRQRRHHCRACRKVILVFPGQEGLRLGGRDVACV